MKLFWKLFAGFGIALAATLAGTIFVSFRLADQASTQLDFVGRERVINEAATVLRERGERGLKVWMRQNPFPAPGRMLLVVDEHNNELNGNFVPTRAMRWLRFEQRAERSSDDRKPPANVRPVQLFPEIVGPDGREYRLVFYEVPINILGIYMWPETQFAVLGISLLAAAIMSAFLARYLSVPIGRMQKAARALAAGALETRLGPPLTRRRDEAGRLAQDFDAMAERLQQLVTDKEALLRDVSHEFRSPLARISVALALAQRRAGDAAHGDLVRIERETERLNELVGQVMTLARLRTTTDPTRVPVGLSDVVREVVEDARFEHPDIEIRHTPTDAPAVLGDPHGLKSAVENIVRNALSHGEGKPVEIEVTGNTKECRIWVRDEGPGVPREDVQRIFEPFYRVDASRDHGSDGQGIGLAITARVMELHGGSATARNRPGGGLEVELVVPVTPPSRQEAAS